MKNKINTIWAILAVLMLFSCSNSDSLTIEGSTTFYGKVIVSPSPVSNGELVTIEIGKWDVTGGNVSVSIGTSAEINGKNVIKCIEYYIDNQKVAESSDKEHFYKASYQIENLSIGEHIVSAHCISNFKGYKIAENIKNFILVVE